MSDAPGSSPTKRILIVDDDEDFRPSIRSLLEGQNYEVFEAADGRRALALLLDIRPDLVITDIVMPEMEGIELISALRRQHPSVKIVALSGSAQASTGKYLEAAKRLGADRTFSKPFDAKKFLDAVHELTRT